MYQLDIVPSSITPTIDLITSSIARKLAVLTEVMCCAYYVETGKIGVMVCQTYECGTIEKYYIEKNTLNLLIFNCKSLKDFPIQYIIETASKWQLLAPFKASEAMICQQLLPHNLKEGRLESTIKIFVAKRDTI